LQNSASKGTKPNSPNSPTPPPPKRHGGSALQKLRHFQPLSYRAPRLGLRRPCAAFAYPANFISLRRRRPESQNQHAPAYLLCKRAPAREPNQTHQTHQLHHPQSATGAAHSKSFATSSASPTALRVLDCSGPAPLSLTLLISFRAAKKVKKSGTKKWDHILA
jgi:hypothetical protein